MQSKRIPGSGKKTGVCKSESRCSKGWKIGKREGPKSLLRMNSKPIKPQNRQNPADSQKTAKKRSDVGKQRMRTENNNDFRKRSVTGTVWFSAAKRMRTRWQLEQRNKTLQDAK